MKKIVITSDKFPALDQLVGQIPYNLAKPLVDFLNLHLVEQDLNNSKENA